MSAHSETPHVRDEARLPAGNVGVAQPVPSLPPERAWTGWASRHTAGRGAYLADLQPAARLPAGTPWIHETRPCPHAAEVAGALGRLSSLSRIRARLSTW